jgi:hypothetical protein
MNETFKHLRFGWCSVHLKWFWIGMANFFIQVFDLFLLRLYLLVITMWSIHFVLLTFFLDVYVLNLSSFPCDHHALLKVNYTIKILKSSTLFKANIFHQCCLLLFFCSFLVSVDPRRSPFAAAFTSYSPRPLTEKVMFSHIMIFFLNLAY